jgi:hypothetical protein
VKYGKEEASPIARVLNVEGETIGWVYQWNTSEISVLWISQDRAAKSLEPPICPETFTTAKAVSRDDTTDHLEALSSKSTSDKG